jgi:hypothetical protein
MKELNRTCKTQPLFGKPGSEQSSLRAAMQPFKPQRTPTRFAVSCDILRAGITSLNSVSLLLPITETNCILWDKNAFLNIVTILVMACFCNPVDKEGSAITITSRITKRTLLAAKPSHVLTEWDHRTTHATGLHTQPVFILFTPTMATSSVIKKGMSQRLWGFQFL